MPNFQTEYEQSVVKLLQLSDPGRAPSEFLKSLVLHAMLKLTGQCTSWQITTMGTVGSTKQLLHVYSEGQPIALPPIFCRVFTHAELLRVLESLWKSFASFPLREEYLKLLASSCDLGLIAKTVQTSCGFFSPLETILDNQGIPYLTGSANLAIHMDGIRVALSMATQKLAEVWVKGMIMHLTDPQRSDPKNPPFVLKLFEYSSRVVEFFNSDHAADHKILHVLPWIHPQTMRMLLEGRNSQYISAGEPVREQLTLRPTALDAADWYYFMTTYRQASGDSLDDLRKLLVRQGARVDFIPSPIPSYALANTHFIAFEYYRKNNIQPLIATAQIKNAEGLIWDYFSRINGSNVTFLQHVVTNYFVGALDETSSQKKELLLLLIDKISRVFQPGCTFNEGPSRSFSKPRLEKNFKAYMTYASFAANALHAEAAFIAQLNTHSPHPWHLPMADATAKQKDNLRVMVASLANEIQFALQEDPRTGGTQTSDRMTSTAAAQTTMTPVDPCSWNNFMWAVLDAAEKHDKKTATAAGKQSANLVLPLIVENNPWIADVIFEYFMRLATSRSNIDFSPQFLRRLVILFCLGDEAIQRFFVDFPSENISFLAKIALYAMSEPRDLDSQTRDMLQKFKEIFLSMPGSGWLTNVVLQDITALVSQENLHESCYQDRQLYLNDGPVRKTAPLRHQRLLFLLRITEQLDRYQPPVAPAAYMSTAYTSTNLYKVFTEHTRILTLFLQLIPGQVGQACTPQDLQTIIQEVLRLARDCHPDCFVAQLQACPSLLRHAALPLAFTIDTLNAAADLPDIAQALFALQPHLHQDCIVPQDSASSLLQRWLTGVYSDDEFRTILKILHKTAYLEVMLFEGNALHALLAACDFATDCFIIPETFALTLQKIKTFCDWIDELDPKLLNQYLQKNIQYILTFYFPANVDKLPTLVRDKYVRGWQQLFSICLPRADSAENIDAARDLIRVIIASGLQIATRADDYARLFWYGFVKSMITDPRLHQNIDHFHTRLQIRAMLCSCLFATEINAADNISQVYLLTFDFTGLTVQSRQIKLLLGALGAQGLLLEFYVGVNATQYSPAALPLQSDTLVMHQALQSHAWGHFFGLCDKLHRLVATSEMEQKPAVAFCSPIWALRIGVWQHCTNPYERMTCGSLATIIRNKDAAGFTAIHCALLAWPHFLTAVSQTLTSRILVADTVSCGIDALRQYTAAVKQLITVLQKSPENPDYLSHHFLSLLLHDRVDAANALALLLDSSENFAQESIPEPLLNAVVKAFNDLFVTFGLCIAKDQNDNKTMRQLLNWVFLKDPALAQRVDARLGSKNPGPIFKQLLHFFEYLITLNHGVVDWENDLVERDIRIMQEHLPHFALKLFTQALQAYASGVGTRHHRETVQLLLPVLQQALQEKTIPAALNDILSGVFTSHSSLGHMHGLLKKFGCLDVTLSQQDFIACGEASKKYCFAEIIWQAFGASDASEVKIQKEVQRDIRRQFLTLTDRENAENDKMLMQAVKLAPELASQTSFMNTLATIVKTYQPETQRKFPYFSLALLQRDLMCFSTAQSSTRDQKHDCAIAVRISDAIEASLQMLLQANQQGHPVECDPLPATQIIIMGILRDNRHTLSSAFMLILLRYPIIMPGGESLKDALATGFISISEAQAEVALRKLAAAMARMQQEISAQAPVAAASKIRPLVVEPSCAAAAKNEGEGEDEYVLVEDSDDEEDKSMASSDSEMADPTPQQGSEVVDPTAQQGTAKTLSQMFQVEKSESKGAGLAVEHNLDWYKDITVDAGECDRYHEL